MSAALALDTQVVNREYFSAGRELLTNGKHDTSMAYRAMGPHTSRHYEAASQALNDWLRAVAEQGMQTLPPQELIAKLEQLAVELRYENGWGWTDEFPTTEFEELTL